MRQDPLPAHLIVHLGSFHEGRYLMPQVTLAARSTADDVLAGVDLVNKTILITGCNSGIGFESMRALLEKVASHAGARG